MGLFTKKKKEEDKNTGCFVASVLLSQAQCNLKQFITDFKEDWGIDLYSEERDKNVLVATTNRMTLAIALMPSTVPNGEAEHYAAANYMWEESVETVQSHKAHILISVLGNDTDILELGKVFTKAVSSCLKQEFAIAVYTDGAVYQPQFYSGIASMMQKDEDALPILDWVWFGVYQTAQHSGIYTYGMKKFGKQEIEVYADADLSEIRDFLLDIVCYILKNNVILKDGETIGFSAEQKLTITLSKGIALEGKTLKIGYK